MNDVTIAPAPEGFRVWVGDDPNWDLLSWDIQINLVR